MKLSPRQGYVGMSPGHPGAERMASETLTEIPFYSNVQYSCPQEQRPPEKSRFESLVNYIGDMEVSTVTMEASCLTEEMQS